MSLIEFPSFRVALLCLAGVLLTSAPRAEPRDDDLALCKAITKAKASLSEGLRRIVKTETPISAKFERDEKGALSLSIYTAAKGVGVAAEGNVLREWAGPPSTDGWNPSAETFKDLEHVARASEQLTLMALTSKTLAEIAAQADKEPLGSTYSITPVVKGRRAYFEVRFLDKGKINEVKYDLLSGAKI